MLTTDRSALGGYMQRSYLSGLTTDRSALGSYMQRSYLSGLTVDRGALGCVLLGANGGAKEEKEKKGLALALGHKMKDWKVRYLDWRIAALQKKLDQLLQKRQAIPAAVEQAVASDVDAPESEMVEAAPAAAPALAVQKQVSWYPGMPSRI